MDGNCKWTERTSVYIVVAAAAVTIVLYTFYVSSGTVNNAGDSVEDNSSEMLSSERSSSSQSQQQDDAGSRRRTVKPKPKPQPSCPLKDHLSEVLAEIAQHLRLRRTMCRPEDVNNPEMHKIPNGAKWHKGDDARGTVVIYIAVALLLTSLGAALVEAYKEKVENRKKPKPQLTRRCSLADLTVLRHTRRESMMRTNSFVEDAKAPLKLLGSRAPALPRQSSLPVTSEDVVGSRGRDLNKFRSSSFDKGTEESPEHRHVRAMKLIRRH